MSNTKEVTSGIAAGLLAEAAGKGMKVAPETLEALRENAPPEPPEAVTEAPEAVEEVDTRTPAERVAEGMQEEIVSEDSKFTELPDFKPIPDEEFAAFDEDEAFAEVAEAREDLDNFDPEEEEVDYDEIKRRLYKAEKALDHQRKLREKQQIAGWRSEASENYPLADVESIQATSRNQFMKQAAHSHNQMYTRLKPKLDELETYRKQVAEQTREEERAKAASDWGQATVGATPADVDMAEYTKELEAARKTGLLEKVIGVKRKYNQ